LKIVTATAPKAGGRIAASLKDAVIAAVISLAIAGPMMGLQTVTDIGGLAIVQRWPLVAATVAVVFVGRLLLNLFVWKTKTPITGIFKGLKLGTGKTANLGRFIGPVLIIFAVLLPTFSGRYVVDLGILVLTYIMLGWGLSIVVGLAGLLDLGYVAFYAVGAYSYALFAHYFGWSFWICLPLSGILAAFWGIILGFPVLRLRGDYLAIVTLAFGEIIRIVLLNWADFTGGPNGISGIPRPSFFGLEFVRGEGGFADFFGIPYASEHRVIFLYYVILVLALITCGVIMRLRRLPVGRAWEALREDEIACRSLGINTVSTKLTAFALGAGFGGFAGAFFATRQGFISPESFVFMESAIILAIVVLGGLGSQIGVVIAATVMIGGFEVFREMAEYRMLVFGLAMVLIMIWRPRGLISTRTPSIFLKARKTIGAENISQGHG
jgi:branched-chain amino acid transport system permease protein